jgi:hypothetical protein
VGVGQRRWQGGACGYVGFGPWEEADTVLQGWLAGFHYTPTSSGSHLCIHHFSSWTLFFLFLPETSPDYNSYSSFKTQSVSSLPWGVCWCVSSRISRARDLAAGDSPSELLLPVWGASNPPLSYDLLETRLYRASSLRSQD